ncbi:MULTISPECIES: hypothetical protein [unclassified Gilliamella]|uniref:hypothetical protein n=1 Tax=unclassified Gilliamella TaxID=2685620 RepID=UPI00080DC536|nr:hypothetical protein [Gilliamella apicola]OCG37487.1 hypothetical protein A9G32_03595 [Gilliamella apicola]OCG48401.1 hypothetical protein A9G27_04730 [Gilliamella apicola]OCG50922.1 hypothetical protein A9G26_05700 [Gilliamella apicola]
MMNFLQTIMGLAVFAALIIGLLTFLGIFILLLCYTIIKQVKSDKKSDKISDEILGALIFRDYFLYGMM